MGDKIPTIVFPKQKENRILRWIFVDYFGFPSQSKKPSYEVKLFKICQYKLRDRITGIRAIGLALLLSPSLSCVSNAKSKPTGVHA